MNEKTLTKSKGQRQNPVELMINSLDLEISNTNQKLDTQRYTLLTKLNKFLQKGMDYSHPRVKPTLFEYISLATLQGKSIRQIGEELCCVDIEEPQIIIKNYKEAKRKGLTDPKLGYDILIDQLEFFNSFKGQAFTIFNQTHNALQDCNFKIDSLGDKAALPKLFNDSGALLCKAQQLQTDLFARLGMYDKASKDLRADQSKLAHQEANEIRSHVENVVKGEKIDTDSIKAIQASFEDRLSDDAFNMN